jgi:small subunit ribosomal protein S4
MGDPKRIRKKYETPGHPWRKENLSEELKLMGEYGLRNKREIWRATSTLRKYRALARSLFTAVGERRAVEEARLIGRLYRLGLLPQNATLDDVLKLTVRDFLDRRLQTMVYRLGIAKTPIPRKATYNSWENFHRLQKSQGTQLPCFARRRGEHKTCRGVAGRQSDINTRRGMCP